MRLADCFNEIFSFTLSLLKFGEGQAESVLPTAQEAKPAMAEPGMKPTGLPEIFSRRENASEKKPQAKAEGIDMEKVRSTYLRLFSASNDLAGRCNFSDDDYRLAKFAVCAWVDEKIVSSQMPQRLQWHSMELQRVFFQTTNAGEEFFTCLISLKSSQLAVLEVYSLCLCLGFQGKYTSHFENEELLSIRRAVARGVLGRSPELSETQNMYLMAQAYPGKEKPAAARSGDTALKIAIAVVPLVLFIGMYVVFNRLLENLMQGLFK